MLQSAIRFETVAAPLPPDPARMDVACFVGLAAQRPGVTAPGAVLDRLAQAFGEDRATLAADGGLLNRPVPVTSLDGFEQLFDCDGRLDREVVVQGGALPEDLSGLDMPDILSVVIDGVIHDIGLSPAPVTPQDAADRIAAAGFGLEVTLVTGPGGEMLRLALPPERGAGTLAVLPCAALGFPQTRRAEGRLMPSPLALALRGFFAMGGRKAWIVAMGPPPAYAADRATRLAALEALLLRPPAGPPPGPPTPESLLFRLGGAVPSHAEEPERHHGPSHIYDLAEASFLLLPDLAELVAPEAGIRALPEPPAGPQEVFDECLPGMLSASDAADSPLAAPVLDPDGLRLWLAASDRVIRMLRQSARDTHLIAAVPRLGEGMTPIAPPRSAFLQLAEGWVRVPASAGAAEGLMAPDGLLAGHLARVALLRGTFASAAGVPLAPVSGVEALAPATTLPTCRLYQDRNGTHVSADLTTSADPSWQDAPVSRIMALLLRQARQMGEALVFEPNGPALWSSIRDVLSGLLEAMRQSGALAGEGAGDSYDVRCDRSTMSQNEIDNGILVAEIWFRPAAPVAAITVRLPLTEGPATRARTGGPA